MAKRKANLTGKCQVCGAKLPGSSRSDKMTCGVKRCAVRWTKHVKTTKEVQWRMPIGLERLANSGEFDGLPFHQVEVTLEKWKMLHDAIGEGIMVVERRQAGRAVGLGVSYSSQFGFYNFIVHGGNKR